MHSQKTLRTRLTKAGMSDTDDRIAITDGQTTLTYKQLENKIANLAQWLRDNDARTIALHAENSTDWVLVDLACQELGVRCIPLPDFFSPTQLENCLQDTLVDLLFTNSESLIGTTLDKNTGAFEVDSLCAIRALLLKPKVRHEDLSIYDQKCPTHTQKITFTSGSTGAPKGVCLTANHQWLTAEALASTINIDAPKHLCLLPLATLLENVAGIYAPLLSGGSIVVPSDESRGLSGSSGLDMERLITCISTVQPNTLILLPQLLTALIMACRQGWVPPKSLKFIAVGGAKVAPKLLEQAHEFGLPVYEGYGLSECCSVVTLNTPENNRQGKAGKLLPHCSLIAVGESIVVSDSKFQGYYDDQESWYPISVYTGDLGTYKDGYLSVHGRRKNTIISSFGRNINPEWVESELFGNSMLLQCVVVGESRPHLGAFLTAPDMVTDKQIQQWISVVNSSLPDYAQVHTWERLELNEWDGLLTANGRPQRQRLNEQFQGRIDALYSNQHVDARTNKPSQPALVSNI